MTDAAWSARMAHHPPLPGTHNTRACCHIEFIEFCQLYSLTPQLILHVHLITATHGRTEEMLHKIQCRITYRRPKGPQLRSIGIDIAKRIASTATITEADNYRP